jgi:hypothetical protein
MNRAGTTNRPSVAGKDSLGGDRWKPEKSLIGRIQEADLSKNHNLIRMMTSMSNAFNPAAPSVWSL